VIVMEDGTTPDAGLMPVTAAKTALDTALARLRAFRADALVLALGFDASEHEPLAALRVTSDGFARAAAAISALGLPTAICQEGGYAVEHLGPLLQRFLGAWNA
jgi:acetoin utilization deacetylase AcuC-like enzyme